MKKLLIATVTTMFVLTGCQSMGKKDATPAPEGEKKSFVQKVKDKFNSEERKAKKEAKKAEKEAKKAAKEAEKQANKM